MLLTLPHERPQQCSLHVVSFGAGDFGEYVNVYSSTRPAFTQRMLLIGTQIIVKNSNVTEKHSK